MPTARGSSDTRSFPVVQTDTLPAQALEVRRATEPDNIPREPPVAADSSAGLDEPLGEGFELRGVERLQLLEPHDELDRGPRAMVTDSHDSPIWQPEGV